MVSPSRGIRSTLEPQHRFLLLPEIRIMRHARLALLALATGLAGAPAAQAQDWPADAQWARFAAFAAPAVRVCAAQFVSGPAHVVRIQALGSARFRISLIDARQGTVFGCVAGAQSGIITSGGPQGQVSVPLRQTNLLVAADGKVDLPEPACWRTYPVADVNGAPLGLLLERLPCGKDGHPTG